MLERHGNARDKAGKAQLALRAAGYARMALNLDPGDWPSTLNLASALEYLGDASGSVMALKLFMEPGRGKVSAGLLT